MTATGRGKLLYRLAELVAQNAGRLAELETRDTGKIIRETSAQIAYVAEYYRYYAGLADKIEGAHLPIDKPDMDVWLRREPIGVVAADRSLEQPAFSGRGEDRTGASGWLHAGGQGVRGRPCTAARIRAPVDEAGFPRVWSMSSPDLAQPAAPS